MKESNLKVACMHFEPYKMSCEKGLIFVIEDVFFKSIYYKCKWNALPFPSTKVGTIK
jgi:hypothetical protein